MKTLAALILASLSALTIAGCGGDPLPTSDDCTPGVCPPGYPDDNCPADVRAPSYCPGETPAKTQTPDGGAAP